MRSVALLGVLVVLMAAGCGGSDGGEASPTTTQAPAPVSRYVSSADLGEAWPLAVSGGTLRCEGRGAVSFETDEGIVYAVNPTATAWSRSNNLGWSDVGLIQADDPATAGRKMYLGRLIATGLRLCREAEREAATTTSE
jgi:hypothetical protein